MISRCALAEKRLQAPQDPGNERDFWHQQEALPAARGEFGSEGKSELGLAAAGSAHEEKGPEASGRKDGLARPLLRGRERSGAAGGGRGGSKPAKPAAVAVATEESAPIGELAAKLGHTQGAALAEQRDEPSQGAAAHGSRGVFAEDEPAFRRAARRRGPHRRRQGIGKHRAERVVVVACEPAQRLKISGSEDRPWIDTLEDRLQLRRLDLRWSDPHHHADQVEPTERHAHAAADPILAGFAGLVIKKSIERSGQGDLEDARRASFPLIFPDCFRNSAQVFVAGDEKRLST